MYSFRISWYNEKIEVRVPELSKLLAERRQKRDAKQKPGASKSATVPKTEKEP